MVVLINIPEYCFRILDIRLEQSPSIRLENLPKYVTGAKLNIFLVSLHYGCIPSTFILIIT